MTYADELDALLCELRAKAETVADGAQRFQGIGRYRQEGFASGLREAIHMIEETQK